MDNLESQTYEAFEKDPVKYSQYEKAIVKALEEVPAGKTTILMVCKHCTACTNCVLILRSLASIICFLESASAHFSHPNRR